MRAVVLAVLVVVGCYVDGGDTPAGTGGVGGTTEPDPTWPITVATSWVVQMNRGQPPSCDGSMNLTLTQYAEGGAVAVHGSWNCVEPSVDCLYVVSYQDAGWQCISFGGDVVGTIATPITGHITMDLATRPGGAVHVTATMTDSSISGVAVFSDGNIPFDAALR